MRLSLTSRPRPVPASVGIVHLGIGAFHRAHQAVYTEDAGDDWGICGITQRSAAVAERLAPQVALAEAGADVVVAARSEDQLRRHHRFHHGERHRAVPLIRPCLIRPSRRSPRMS